MLPLQGTDIAVRWDNLYNFLLWLSVVLFVAVVGAMVYFAFKYKAEKGRKTTYMTGNHLLEGIFVVIPTLLLMVIFGWGWSVYREMREAPSNAYEIHVLGKQWLWTFQYDNGRTTVGDLYVPLNKPVKLIMTSQDVIHGFFVPNFRIKQDVVPGMYTSVWFEARVPGKHQIFCSMYCGTSHSGMLGKVVVLNDKQWQDWLDGRKIENIPEAGEELTAVDPAGARKTASISHLVPLAAQGKQLFASKGCVTCHSDNGESRVGPTMKGIYGASVALADGHHVLADDNYIRESIELPQAKIVKGFSPLMPTFKGLIDEPEMNALIAYIKSVK